MPSPLARIGSVLAGLLCIAFGASGAVLVAWGLGPWTTLTGFLLLAGAGVGGAAVLRRAAVGSG